MDVKIFEQALERLKQRNFSDRVYIRPSIPEKQLKNMVSSMKIPDSWSILVIVDTTLSKNGKGGICVTSDSIYWKEFLNKGSLRLAEIKYLNMDYDGFHKDLKFNAKDISLKTLTNQEIEPFVEFLKEVSGPKEAKVKVKEDAKEKKMREKKDIPFTQWGKGGICDACNVDFEGEAYMVPVDVFYGSKKYKDWLVTGPMSVLVEMAGGVNVFIANAMSKDHTTHSIVCSSCVHLFM